MAPFHHAGNLVPLFDETPAKPFDMDSSRLLQLSNFLQTSLEIERIIADFSDNVRAIVPHDQISYCHEAQDIDYSIGKNARHTLSYQLKLNDESLGNLVLSRRRKFDARETQQLENLLCALLYPIRNALLYRKAVAAAHHDPLTGVGNRAAFNASLDREVELANRHKRSLGMIVIDIDHFKRINDTFGHATGDCLIRALANCTDNTIRLTDQLFRYGGEEFVVLMPEASPKGIKQLAERIRRNVEDMDVLCEGHRIQLTASFGVAILNKEDDEESFFIRADKALYQAKADGRNCIRVAE